MRRAVVSTCWVLTFLVFAVVSATAADKGGFRGPSGGKGGFYGPSAVMVSVEKAKTLPDDAHVVLRGVIERHISKDKYEFRDASGTIVVEIDGEAWGGQNVTPDDTVELRGEIDRDLTSLKVDVDRVTKVQ